MRLFHFTFLLGLLHLACSGPREACATTFVDQPFPETVKDASVIVRGKVGASHVDWSLAGDGGKQIFTFYALQVAEVFKGEVKDKSALLIREMGGEKDGVGMHVSGASRFQKDEDVVVLLGKRNRDGSHDVRGLMMGKLNIVQDQSGKEVLSGPALVHSGDGTGGHTGSTEERHWTLDALRDLVRAQKGGAAEGLTPRNRTSQSASLSQVGRPASPPSSASGAASGLHKPTSEESMPPPESGFPGWTGLAWIGLGVFAIWAVFRRFRK